MDFLTFNQFVVLLWKNFTIKRRHYINLLFEVLTAAVFPILLLLFRSFNNVNIEGPRYYNPIPISGLPSFLKNPQEWELIYVPSNINVVKEIIENVKRNLNISIRVHGFYSESEFETYVKYDYTSHKVLAAVVFDNDFKNINDSLPLQVKYHLRFVRRQRTVLSPKESGWKTSLLFPIHPTLGPRNPADNDGGRPGYIREGFLAVQHALDKAIMLYHGDRAAQKLFDGISVLVQRFPHPAYSEDGLLKIISTFLPLMFLLMFSPTVLSIMRTLVSEKEKRLKIINEPIFRYSDHSFIFVFLMCYAIASILFGFMVSTFFNKVHLAASAGSLLYFASFFPFKSIINNYGQITFTNKMAACLSSNVALALGINLLLKLEIKEIGLKWDNLWTPATLEDNLTYGYMMGMLLLDAFLYGLVTWYIEAVFPGKYGVSQPWNFFLMRSYWYGNPRIIRKEEEMKGCGRTQSKYFEAEPTGLVAGIQIKHLHKEFGAKVAVNNMSLNLYKGQITILLGENKAGKTTTLSILTGCLPPTRGEVYVNGYTISKNLTDIRKKLGLCPQCDLLFNDLTLSEHLYFYFMLKRKCQKMYPMEADHMLSTFNLLEKRDTISKSLSTGMKRKLSVMIALIGDSEVAIFDEPTAGMDPISKRVTWDLLRQYKQDRTILVTTHHMEEADILGDRIAIMVKGTLQCCGSSVFLKQIYGATYRIIMEIEPQCDVEKLSAVIQSYIPHATLEKYTEAELSFILPKEYIERFEALFDDLKEKKSELGIASFDASITTMEEVFHKVNKLANSQVDILPTISSSLEGQRKRRDMKQNRIMPRNYNTPVSSRLDEIASIEFNTGFPLYCQQFYCMFIKRALFSLRNWKLMLLQISVIVVVTAYLLTTQNLLSEVPIREIDLSQYGRTVVPYSVSGESDLAMNFIKNLKIFLMLKNQEFHEAQGNVRDYILEIKEFNYFSIIAFSIEVEKNKTIFTILFNNEAYHSATTSLAVLDNILFMSLSGPSASIKVSNKPQPLPLYISHTVPISRKQTVSYLAFGMAIIVASFGLQTVNERITKAKHIQFVSGVYVLTYWLSALLWDLIYFFISCCLLLGVFKYCELAAFVENYNFLDTLMIFMLYGWSAVPLMYLGSFLFTSSTAAYIKLTLFNYFSTVFSLIVQTILEFYEIIGDDISYFHKVFISNVFLMLPSYNFAISVSRFLEDYEVKRLCSQDFQNIYVNCNERFTKNNIYSFGNQGIAKFLISLAVLGLFYLLLLFCLETTSWRLKNFLFQKIVSKVYNIFMKGKKAIVSTHVVNEHVDENVENERKKVLAQPPKLKKRPLLLKELVKTYYKCPVVKAVRNVSLVVKNSECLGLLGLNGAGKTSILKMLTGDETISSGAVFIDGISIIENIRKVRSRIGYCPQSNPVLNHMTGRELLIMYARLQGVPEPNICKYVEIFLYSMNLKTHADNFVYTYSEEDKRKLNTIIALMGKSSVVFLDEPSSGMDPIARRLLWDTITWMCKAGKAIIITSHSMEECEALCTRLAIMVKGRFKCLDSPQQLKNKFSDIYTLTVKIKIDKNENKQKEFKEFIATTFPGNIVNQEYRGIIYYHIPKKEICWGKVFSILEKAKVLFNLEDYFISQITLEQVFLAIANVDKMEGDQEVKLL
ncbi:phospholipid-transporting ATPase ABCA3-like isoform X2 [Eptesicus fuscus]|uniref:phospholipid-transporting ATPase ABCA3-like isoform X2 n=2 Tax=Eptesicus fuscus TaxID=29078 RepID=UPI00240474CE|nr:phospholipid-transporting ATPase ABCA3-like isoform X2 [Eptesicus fuscus]